MMLASERPPRLLLSEYYLASLRPGHSCNRLNPTRGAVWIKCLSTPKSVYGDFEGDKKQKERLRALPKASTEIAIGSQEWIRITGSPYLDTQEANIYLRYPAKSSGVRMAVQRGELTPTRRGSRGTHLFTTDELDRFLERRARKYKYGEYEPPEMELTIEEEQHTDEVPRSRQDRGREIPGARESEGPENGKMERAGPHPHGRNRKAGSHESSGAITSDASREDESSSKKSWGIRAIVDEVQDAKTRRGDG